MPDYNDGLRLEAIRLGCAPQWRYTRTQWAWHCTCRDNAHGFDRHSAMITASGLSRFDRAEEQWRPVFQGLLMDAVFLRAVELGCTPVWRNRAWACHCPKSVHGSEIHGVITASTLERAEATL